MLASSRKPCDAANPKRRAKSCALRCGRGLAATRKRRPSARPTNGPMKSSAPTQGTAALHDRHPPPCLPPPGSSVRLPYIVGRAFTPAGGLAAARKGIGKARRRTPQSALPTAPLTGEPFRRQFSQSLPCKGLRSRAPPAAEKARRSRFDGRRAQACFSARRAMRAPQTGRWMRRKAQTEGCIAGLRRRYPARPGRALPYVS